MSDEDRYAVGDRVRAVEDQVEEGFEGQALYVHARVGDVGTVEHVERDEHGDWVSVRWEPSGSACLALGDVEITPALSRAEAH